MTPPGETPRVLTNSLGKGLEIPAMQNPAAFATSQVNNIGNYIGGLGHVGLGVILNFLPLGGAILGLDAIIRGKNSVVGRTLKL
ncbi:MAG: hypothetical protein PHZ00_07760 [Candidatus Peribacteraceae bacterium]|nr:hypothetical protein [Candidatus Peribacteraceae bacterium]